MNLTESKAFPLNFIYFYLTRQCNLRCRHCWISPRFQSTSDISDHTALGLHVFDDILDQALSMGLSGVKLTGGEPLMHPDFIGILKSVKKRNLRLNVETNAVLCDAEIAQELSNGKNPFVSVSLDGVNAYTHDWVRGVEGTFQAALRGIRNLVDVGLSPQIIMTIMRINVDQMEDMIHLAEDIGAGSVKFNIVQPTARGENLHRNGETLSINQLVELGRWVETALCDKTPLRVTYSHPHAFRPLGRMFGNNGDGCAACGILRIIGVLADGSYALCGIGETLPEMVFGNAKDDYLKDIWVNSPILTELRQGLPDKLEGICNQCLMIRSCLGNCIAQNYYRSNKLWSPFWYCTAAFEAGIFPENRLR